jgi:hypothetical protein
MNQPCDEISLLLGIASGPLTATRIAPDRFAMAAKASVARKRRLARAFGRAGANVAVAARGEEAGARARALLEEDGTNATFLPMDVRDESSVAAAVDAVRDCFGRLDFAFNCAGAGGDMAPLECADQSVWDDVMAVTARGVWVSMRHETARELWPELMGTKPLPEGGTHDAKNALVREVLSKLADDHPTNATIVADATKDIAQATDFVKQHDLVGLPDQPCRVIEMPEYRRGVYVARCEPPGPLEAKGETHVTISPVPSDWSAARAASFYREYNEGHLADLMVHEAMPGHFVQRWRLAQWKTAPRAVFRNGGFSEGWAVYSEWLMVKYGFGGPRVRIQWLKSLARTCVNAILDHEIHAGAMDEKAALDLMQNAAFQEEGEAVIKWGRARVSVAQLSYYFYGFTELMKMRAVAEKQPGFTERVYNDRLLSFGSPSVHQLRAAMGM